MNEPSPVAWMKYGSLVAMVAACWFASPEAAIAQSGSSLFAVGESSKTTKPVKPVVKAAAKPVVAARSEAAKPAKVTVAPAKAAPRPTARKSSKGKPVAKGKSRKVASKSASPIALNGRWHDSECIPLTGVTHKPPLFVKRQYEFVDSRKAWALDAAVYSSDSCVINTRMLTYHGEGSFAVTGKSSVAKNAYDASFRINEWRATPDTREGVLTLLNGRCGSGDFEEGRSLDLSATGCPALGIRSLAQAPREVELVSVSNGKFFLGTRSFVPGMADDRPAQLSSYGLVRTP